MEKPTRLLNDCGPDSNSGTPAKPSERLRELYLKKAEAGLIDVKFDLDLSNAGPDDFEKVCAEVLAIDEAITAGRFEPLSFGDLRWKD